MVCASAHVQEGTILRGPNRGQVIVEYGVENGVQQSDYSAAIYADLTEEQVNAVQKILDELIRPNWNQRSCVPS